MQIDKLDHVNVRTNQIDKMINWYSTVLGFTSGNRPNFPFPGAWLYAGHSAVVHLVGVDGNPGAGSEVDLKIEHYAFAASGSCAQFEAKLRDLGEPYKRTEVASFKLIQINVWDPDGNHIHIDFIADAPML